MSDNTLSAVVEEMATSAITQQEQADHGRRLKNEERIRFQHSRLATLRDTVVDLDDVTAYPIYENEERNGCYFILRVADDFEIRFDAIHERYPFATGTLYPDGCQDRDIKFESYQLMEGAFSGGAWFGKFSAWESYDDPLAYIGALYIHLRQITERNRNEHVREEQERAQAAQERQETRDRLMSQYADLWAVWVAHRGLVDEHRSEVQKWADGVTAENWEPTTVYQVSYTVPGGSLEPEVRTFYTTVEPAVVRRRALAGEQIEMITRKGFRETVWIGAFLDAKIAAEYGDTPPDTHSREPYCPVAETDCRGILVVYPPSYRGDTTIRCPHDRPASFEERLAKNTDLPKLDPLLDLADEFCVNIYTFEAMVQEAMAETLAELVDWLVGERATLPVELLSGETERSTGPADPAD